MLSTVRAVSRAAVLHGSVAVFALTLLSGCAGRDPDPSSRSGGEVPRPPGERVEQRVVTHPTGRYELRGDGTTTSPYYWVWVPTGATVVTTYPTLPTVPTVVVTAPEQRVVTHPSGRYQLAGEGTAESPYYWVWVPTGANPPPPPPFRRRAQTP